MLCCPTYRCFVSMELYQTAITGIILKFSEGSVALNSTQKSGSAVSPEVVLRTYPGDVDGWFEEGAGVKNDQRVFSGPGEYERSGLCVRGVGTETVFGSRSLQTTSWFIDSEGVRCFVLGDVSDKSSAQKVISDEGDVDVFCLFLSFW